jgi:hypothetical protein
MPNPIAVYIIIFLALLILSGFPAEVKKKKALMITIKGTRTTATQKMKSIIPCITSSTVSHSRGLGIVIAITTLLKKGIRRRNKNIR